MIKRKRRLYQGPPVPYSLVVGPDRDGVVCVVTGSTDDAWAQQTTTMEPGRGGRPTTRGQMVVRQNADGGGDRAEVHYRDRDGRTFPGADGSRDPIDVIAQHEEIRDRRAR